MNEAALHQLIEVSLNNEASLAIARGRLDLALVLLKRLEWGSCDGCLAKAQGHCLICGADYPMAHAAGCEIARVLSILGSSK